MRANRMQIRLDFNPVVLCRIPWYNTMKQHMYDRSRSVEVIGLLLGSGININQKNMLGMNALLLVAGYGDDKLVRMVLSAGADPNSVNDFGHSALHLVIVGKRSQLKKLIQDGAGDKISLDNFNNLKNAEVALKDWAARNKKIPVDSRKLEKAASLMTNIGFKLQKKITKIQEDSEQEVIKQRVEAVWYHRQEKLLSCKRLAKKSGRLESLLSCRGNKKNKNQDDTQPYLSVPSRASKRINTERDKEVADMKDKFGRILMLIADAGCDVGATEKTFGMTALDMAILLEDIDSTGLLVARGADPEHLLKMFALSDLHEAIISGDKKFVEKLLTYDVDLDINHPFSTFNVEAKPDENDDDGYILSDGVTPLTVAVQLPEEEGNAYKVAKILLKNKSDVDKMGPGGTTPLMEACRVGNVKMAELLISHGADVNIHCPRYNEATPIIIAAVFSRVEIAHLLADKLATLDVETTDERCALTEAYRNDNIKILETVLRGSLGQSFSDKSSFTYEMVVKYQRPDKTDVNVILKLVGEEVKRRDDERRKKELAARKKQSISFLRSMSEPASEKMKNSDDNELNSGQSDTAPVSSALSDSNLLEDSPKRRSDNMTQVDSSNQQSNNYEIPKFPSLEAHKIALTSKVEENVDQGLKQIKSNLESKVQSAFDERINKPLQSAYDQLSEEQRDWSDHISNALKAKVEEQEEDWEDDTDFQEHYYPAASMENGRSCLMTTPILGRCTQVRQNFAQADSYLKDVVKTGNLQKLSISTMRTIDDDFEDDGDLDLGKNRTETDI